MISQLRTYTINRGMMASWIKLFNEQLLPMQQSFGMKIDAAWVNEDQTEFIWVRSFSDAEAMNRQEAAFYASPEWLAVREDARAHHAKTRFEIINSVLPMSTEMLLVRQCQSIRFCPSFSTSSGRIESC